MKHCNRTKCTGNKYFFLCFFTLSRLKRNLTEMEKLQQQILKTVSKINNYLSNLRSLNEHDHDTIVNTSVVRFHYSRSLVN